MRTESKDDEIHLQDIEQIEEDFEDCLFCPIEGWDEHFS